MNKIEEVKIQIETLVKNKNELLEKVSEIREEENKVMNEISSIDGLRRRSIYKADV